MRRALLVIAAIASTACLDVVSPGEEERLRDAERKWDRANITDYTYQMRTSCFCPPEIHLWAIVRVREDRVVSATSLDGAPLAGFDLASRLTVDEMFALAHARYDWLDDIDFDFDETLGYPLRIEHITKRNVADGGAVYEARNLTPE